MSGLSQPANFATLPNFGALTSWCDDLIVATSITSNTWLQVVSGGTTTSTVTPEAGAFGIWELSRGATAGNRAAMVARLTASAAGIFAAGDGAIYHEWRVRIPVLSNGVDRFVSHAGVASTNAGTSQTPTHSIHFRQVDDENSGNWQAICAAGGAQSILNTNIPPVANTWQIVSASVNALGTLVTFAIDGVSVGSLSTGIPTYAAGSNLGPFIALFGEVGTTDRHFQADWMKLQKSFDPARYP